MSIWSDMQDRSSGETVRKEDIQDIEISIKREQFVAFWKITVTVTNKTALQRRTLFLYDVKKLTEDDVLSTFKSSLGLDLSCLSRTDWDDNNKWDLSEYKKAQVKKINSLTIRPDGTVKPLAIGKVRKLDGDYIGYIQLLCGTVMHKYQEHIPWGLSSEHWMQGYKEWEKRLPTFKSVDAFNAWKEEYCDSIYPLVMRIEYYYKGLVEGESILLDSDTEQEVLGLKPSLDHHLSVYQKQKEKYYEKYPDYYDRCDYYIGELSKDMKRVKEFYVEYEDCEHPSLEHRPPQDEILDIFVTYECYLGAKEEAPNFFTDEYIAEHFKF